MTLSIDCETTGIDFYHGARPYFITTCDENGQQRWWEWNVDPETRQPQVPETDLIELRELLAIVKGWGKFTEDVRKRHVLVGQNIKFDVAAMASLGLTNWPWAETQDTLIAGHLLASNQPHDLTSMVMHYLGEDIEPYEKALEEACKGARRLVQQAQLRVKRRREKVIPPIAPSLFDPFDSDPGDGYPEDTEPLARYRIAGVNQPDMPSAKKETWKLDGWLPRALAEELNYPTDHPWRTVLRDYANTDSAYTVALWQVLETELHRRGLWEIYLESMKISPVLLGMERRGVTYNKVAADRLKDQFRRESTESKLTCLTIAKEMNYELQLPKGASPNGSLRRFCFEVLKLPPQCGFKAKTAEPTLDKTSLDHYEVTLESGPALTFIKSLRSGRRRDIYLAYLESYDRFGLPLESHQDWLVLHPSINQTGTDTLRPSSSNPNGQNVGKQGLEEEGTGGDISLRSAFGPLPGREWWALDYENIELRIPAYASGEEKMIELFERPNDPPYFGSYHLLNGSIIYPDLFWQDVCPNCLGRGCKATPCQPKVSLSTIKGAFKDLYADTWYQWLKNFDFAVQYMAGRATADRAAHKPGAFDAVQSSLPKVAALKQRIMSFAEKHGYVETVPDRTVNPRKGYPLLVTRSEYGKIVPTTPFSYFVQGTAMDCARKALVRCQGQLDEWNTTDQRGYYMPLFVHDELVFDFPAGGKLNLPKVKRLQQLMEQSGDNVGIPLKVAISYHPRSWAEKVKL